MKGRKLFAVVVAAIVTLQPAASALASCASPPESNYCISASGYSQSEWSRMVVNYTITSTLPYAGAESIIAVYVNVDRSTAACPSTLVYEYRIDDDGKVYSLSTCNQPTGGTYLGNATFNRNGLSGAFIIPLNKLGNDDGDASVRVTAGFTDNDWHFDETVISVEITEDESP